MASRKLVVEVIGDSRSLERAFDKSSRSAKGFGRDLDKTGKKSRSVFSGIGKTIGFASGALGAIGLAGAARAAFTEMADAQKVTAQTNAVLKSTGGIANVTAKQIDTQAEALMRLSGVDDEVIKSGQNMLLTFTKVRNRAGKGNKIFKKATELTLDLSVAMGKDMKSSAILVGKALNDPIKGITSLTRAGVQFTPKQKTLIKTLVATGKEMEAQKIILKELEVQFGGSAKAAGGTLPGKLNILRESLLNLGGAIAQKLAPELTKIVDKITDWLLKSENQQKIMDAVKTASEVLAGALKFLRGAFKKLNDITGSSKRSLKLLLGALAAFKTLVILGRLAHIARAVGAIGGSADVAIGRKGGGGVRGLVSALGGIKALGPVLALTIAITLIIKNKKEVSDWLKSHGLEAISHGIQNVTGLVRPRQGTGRTGPKPVSNLPNLPSLRPSPTPIPTPRPPPLPTRPPPKGTRSLYGAATIVNVNGNVVTPDPDRFLRDMQKRAARSRAQQRGVRPGVNLGGA